MAGAFVDSVGAGDAFNAVFLLGRLRGWTMEQTLALNGLMCAAAREVGSRNITVNCVAPGFIDTDMTRAISAGAHEEWAARIPMQRLGSPEVARQLVADDADEIRPHAEPEQSGDDDEDRAGQPALVHVSSPRTRVTTSSTAPARRAGLARKGEIAVGGRPVNVIVKRPRPKYWHRYLTQIGRGARARHAGARLVGEAEAGSVVPVLGRRRLHEILRQNATLLKLAHDDPALWELARRSRPRQTDPAGVAAEGTGQDTPTPRGGQVVIVIPIPGSKPNVVRP